MVALKHLRSQESPRTLWVDVLSIDQSNNKEKCPQVAMMGEIYRLAFRVIAWLGPEENESDRAMEMMGHIGSQIVMDWQTHVTTPIAGSLYPSLADDTANFELQSEKITAIYHLINRNWYDRLWIRQEIYLANEQAMVQCGSYHTSWDVFRRSLRWLCSKLGHWETFYLKFMIDSYR
jgi:hypothetical protein